jgi:hypothetical protein
MRRSLPPGQVTRKGTTRRSPSLEGESGTGERVRVRANGLTPIVADLREDGGFNLTGAQVAMFLGGKREGQTTGRPTKWVASRLRESVSVGKPGMVFDVLLKWKRKEKKLGTPTVTVGGLRWRRGNSKPRNRNRDSVAEWFEDG